MSEQRLVNLAELAQVLDLSDNALRAMIRRAPDFPVVSRGSHGVPYEFDLDAVLAWRDDHQAQIDEAEQQRRDQLEMWRAEIYGPDPEGDQATPLTPAERRQMAEAVKIEDYNRIRRGQLIEREPMQATLAAAVIDCRRELRQLPAEFARRVGLEREHRIVLEHMVDERLGALARRLGNPETVRELVSAA